MIIHGDNLEALKALPPEYEGKVDCIYIDPPYNTGNLERPTRADRRAMRRAAVQETGGTSMHMPVSKEVAAAFESTRNERRASL